MKLGIILAASAALALSACSSYGGNDSYRNSSYNNAPTNCYDCGVVQRVESYTGQQRRTSGAGAVAGALIGGAFSSHRQAPEADSWSTSLESGGSPHANNVVGSLASCIGGENDSQAVNDDTVSCGDGGDSGGGGSTSE